MHVIREGSGPPLLLIHGVGHYGGAWRPVIDLLRDDFDVIAPDSPGFGASPELPGDDYRLDAYVDAFAELMADLGLERPHVAGNSMGGAITLELARRGLVSSATAISPGGFGSPLEAKIAVSTLGILAGAPGPMFAGMVRATHSRVGRTLVSGSVFGRPWAMPAEETERTLRNAHAAPAMKPALAALAGYRFRGGEDIPDDIPVTVLWGRRDILLYHFLQAPRARRELPHARHITLGGMGHTPFYDDPGQVAGGIRLGTGQWS